MLVSEPSGNFSYSQAYVWKVDTIPPVPVIKTGPPAVSAAKQASFAFSATDNTAPNRGLCRDCTYSCALIPVTNLTTCDNITVSLAFSIFFGSVKLTLENQQRGSLLSYMLCCRRDDESRLKPETA